MVSINPDFASLIPPLTDEERDGLERSILEEGIREPIAVWRGWIVDGHNRYEIARKYGLPFDTVEYAFADESEAKRWMICNQFARRNLSAYQRSVLALKLEPVVADAARKRMLAGKADPTPTLAQGETRDELAKAAGVSHGTLDKVKRIEIEASDELRDQLRSGEVSINEAYKRIREDEKRAERQAAIEEAKSQPRSSSYVDIFSTGKKYRVIYADPPWSYNDKQDTARLGGAEKHYRTMALEDICAIEVPAEKNAVLFLWATSPLLPDALAVIDGWGFAYKSSFIWDKVSNSMGHYNSVRHEFLLIATRGSCTPDSNRRYDSVVSIERGEHSRKPAYFRDLIDELYPIGERIELFAREAAEGWDVWGDMA